MVIVDLFSFYFDAIELYREERTIFYCQSGWKIVIPQNERDLFPMNEKYI